MPSAGTAGPTPTVLGHSYGTLVAGKALTEHSDLPVDNVIFVGSPGVGMASTRRDSSSFSMITPSCTERTRPRMTSAAGPSGWPPASRSAKVGSSCLRTLSTGRKTP
ncbi:alpha/beta hydrolase [Streptomyces sp. NPDC020858]|uniref:alpha/beta hydrolase n=1 Tax=Streptomyces sp. NPDC020858 TaxID=3365097 RepID=UPI0037B97FD2